MWFISTKENIIRVLSGLKPNATFWCRVNLHDWDRWEMVDSGKIYGARKINYQTCKRECKLCGLPQLKTVLAKEE